MASPQFKKPTGTAPTRRLLGTGAAPKTTVRLKASNGQAIQAKAPAAFAKRTAPGAKPEEKLAEKAKEEKSLKEVATEETPTAEQKPLTPPVESDPQEQPSEERGDVQPQPVEQPSEGTPEPVTQEPPPVEEHAPEAQPEGEGAGVVATDEEEEARKRAEEEYARQMEEYNRQMEEYNRQMEEYNRQQALLQQQAEAAAAAEQPTAEEAPTAEEQQTENAVKPEGKIKPTGAKALAVGGLKVAGLAKPVAGGAKPAPGKKASVAAKPAAGGLKKAVAPLMSAKAKPEVPAPSPEPPSQETDGATPVGEETTAEATEQTEQGGTNQVDAAYVSMLQQTAQKRPIHKSKGFIIACGVLVVFAGFCGYLVVKQNAENAAMRERNARIMGILSRAREINKLQIESLAEARKKNVNVKCSKKEAEFLMDVIVNPEMKDENGKPMFGNHPDGVAQLACLLVGIASEADESIGAMVFSRLHKEARKIKPHNYRWLVQRLALADIKGINDKLHDLATKVAKMDAKKFSKRDQVLSYIWEAMGLRVTEKDIEPITELLKDPETSNGLVETLSICLRNIVERMEDPAKRSELGDKIFELLPENKRPYLMATLAKSCSPKALEYYKQRAITPNNWRADRDFFANYGSDDIITYLVQDMKPAAGDDPKLQKLVDEMIASVVRQDRDRKPEDAEKLVKMVYDKLDVDTSAWEEINEKTDKDSADFVGEDSPEYAELMKKRADIEGSRKQKLDFIRVLSGMRNWPWVVQYLEKLKKEPENQVSSEAARAHEKVLENTERERETQERYNRRTKEL